MAIKPLLGIPTAFTGVYTSDIFRAFMRIAAQGWPLAETECGRIDVVRNRMAAEAIKGGFTHLVMLDADHVHPADTVHKLIRWAMKDRDRYQVVGGLQRPWWRYEYPEGITDFGYPSEDVYFSRTCREAGIPLWVDTTVTSPHMIKAYADKAMMEQYLAARPQDVQVMEDGDGCQGVEADSDRDRDDGGNARGGNENLAGGGTGDGCPGASVSCAG